TPGDGEIAAAARAEPALDEMDTALAGKPHGDGTGARDGASFLLAHRRPERGAVDGEEATVILEDVSGPGLDGPSAKLELADPWCDRLADRREGDRGVHRAPAPA